MDHSCGTGGDFSVITRVVPTGRNQRIRLLSFLTTPYALPPQDMFIVSDSVAILSDARRSGTETEQSHSSATV